jgi:hypothetical protein
VIRTVEVTEIPLRFNKRSSKCLPAAARRRTHGELTAEGLREVLYTFNIVLSEAQLQDFVRRMDADGDGERAGGRCFRVSVSNVKKLPGEQARRRRRFGVWGGGCGAARHGALAPPQSEAWSAARLTLRAGKYLDKTPRSTDKTPRSTDRHDLPRGVPGVFRAGAAVGQGGDVDDQGGGRGGRQEDDHGRGAGALLE